MSDIALIEALRRMNLAAADEAPAITPLTGGVSSDISRVDTRDATFCVKRALAKLKVAADWRAPVARNHSEAEWLRVAGAIVPDAVPQLLAEDADAGLFAMEWLPPEQFPVWKAELRDGRIDPAFAAAVGERIAAIHAATARRDDMAARFANDAIFHPIRLEPYLLATAVRHPRCAAALEALVARRPRIPGSRWSTATSARRTSSPGRAAPCSSMPSAPGTAIPRSTSRSASTTCC